MRTRALAARTTLVAGALRGPALAELLESIPRLDREAFTDELLAIDPPPPDRDLPRGAVPYLPCSVDHILALTREVAMDHTDELVDIGSGLGRVVILAHLLTGVRARGIEIQSYLVERAQTTSHALGLRDVQLSVGNAAEMPLDGRVFVLYAPCNGAMLASVLDRLADVARRRTITVCTVDLDLVDIPWLAGSSCPSSPGLSIYVSR